ncbi:putative secreted pili protein [Lysobacter dokdonensis DS-58]|uniref:Putative secreted pili protein n=1 Tax=Lysobacter dokdonensis DS-58 TaxID=1300345 RepID=A0A0A2X268_9GAMM|nr:spore coat U domain-containing protein [Lysobacter dokdonensis]KGQ19329.1 putative secreted pili protein [Lysobacter dokdonensis DS-58]
MTQRVFLALLLGLLWFALPMAARAQTCTVNTSSAVSFGNYDPTRVPPTDITGNVQVRCFIENVTVTVSLAPGGSNNFANRRMDGSSGDTLNYNLYKDAARSIVFGSGIGQTQTMTCTTGSNNSGCTGTWFIISTANFPIYGRIPAGQYVGIGTYQDDVPITVTF